MTDYLSELFRNIKLDNGKKINLLIDKGIINYHEVLDNLLNMGSSRNLLLFATYIEKVSTEDKIVIAKELIRRKSYYEITIIAKDVIDSLYELFEEAIISSDNAYIIYDFAFNVGNINIEKFENKIIELGNPVYIFRFALNIKGANISKLEKAIILTNNSEYISLFATRIANANLELLEEALSNNGNLDDFKAFLKYKNKVQKEDYNKLCNSIKNNDINDLELNKDRYAYLFKEPSEKVKALVRKINNLGY